MELWSENAKTGRRRVCDIHARLFETTAQRQVARGRGVATDAVQMPEARCPLRGSLRNTVLGSYTYPKKSSAVMTKRRSMASRGGVDGVVTASHVVGAGVYGSAGTRLSEQVTAGT